MMHDTETVINANNIDCIGMFYPSVDVQGCGEKDAMTNRNKSITG